MQIGSAFWHSRVLHVAARLDIATALGDRALAVDALASTVSAQPDALYRVLRMLAVMGVFEEVSPRVFANNRLSSALREDRPGCVRAMILMHNSDAMSRPWYEQLERSVRQGGVPFVHAHGTELFEHLDAQPELDALFSSAMDSVQSLTGDSFTRDFDWGRFDRVIDVGGSKGGKSIELLRRHPRLQALVVDRAQVVRDAERHWSAREEPRLLSRLCFQPGDVLESVPAATSERDIYLLSAVLHSFDDATCVRALRNLSRACGSTGARIVLMELVLAERGVDLAAAAFDMQMFMGTRGRERTLAEWSRLFETSGLQLEEHVKLQSLVGILLLRSLSVDGSPAGIAESTNRVVAE